MRYDCRGVDINSFGIVLVINLIASVNGIFAIGFFFIIASDCRCIVCQNVLGKHTAGRTFCSASCFECSVNNGGETIQFIRSRNGIATILYGGRSRGHFRTDNCTSHRNKQNYSFHLQAPFCVRHNLLVLYATNKIFDFHIIPHPSLILDTTNGVSVILIAIDK